MPKLKKQALHNTISIYLGIVIGYLNTVLLFPRFFSDSEFGLTRIFLAVSSIIAILAHAGIPAITTKYFPVFKNKQEGHRGFLFMATIIPTVGFLFTVAIYFLASPLLESIYSENSPLFSKYLYWVLPIAGFQLFFETYASYAVSLYHSDFANFQKNVTLRLAQFALILTYHFGELSFDLFLLLYALSFAVPLILLIAYLISKNEFNLRPDFSIFTRKLKRELSSFGLFTLLNRFSGMLNKRLDVLMIAALLSEAYAGIYMVAFFFAELIQIPANGIIQVANPLTAEAFRKNDQNRILDLYKKTSLNQLILGLMVFGPLVICGEELLSIASPKYAMGYYALIFVSVGKLFFIGTGTNNQIILNSKFYRFNLLFILILIVTAFILNYFLIPRIGITGASIATALAVFSNNAIKTLFVYKKFNMQPFSITYLKHAFSLLIIIAILIFTDKLFLNQYRESLSLAIFSKPAYNEIFVNGLWAGIKGVISFSFLFAYVKVAKPSEELDNMLNTAIKKVLPNR